MKNIVTILFITSLLLCIFCSCRATRCSSASLQDLRFEKEVTQIKIERIDTIVDYRPPKSLSQNIFDIESKTDESFSSDKSVLETEYSKSSAQVVNGKLIHTIENKDLIPMKVQQNNYTEASKDSTDHRKDLSIEKIVEKKRFGEDFFYLAGVLASLLICVIIVGRFIIPGIK